TPGSGVTDGAGKLASLPVASRAGYTFDGWFTAASGGVKVTTATVFDKATTIFARWTAVPPVTAYTITFDYQGGSGTPGSGVTDGAGKLASLPVPTKDGFTFDGWFTAASGGAEVTTATVFTKATTIFARWTAVPPVPPVDGGYVPPKKPVIVDGKTVNIGTEKKSGSTTTLTPDQKRLTAEIGKAKDKGSVIVPLSENTTAVARLMVKNVEDMAAKNMTLSVKTGGIRYDLPTAAMDVKALADAFPGVDTAKIPFDVTIKESGVTVKDAAVTATPTEFIITATSGDKTVATDRFSVFVDRAFEITKAQSEKITTAVVVEPDGKLRHVPTFVYETNGKYYAIVKSMTNSVYALIQNEITFPDVKGKWYEDVANEVGSRKIVMGTDKGIFNGDEKITRAEFAAMIVRALGLPTGKTGTFTDVPRDAWYAGSVATAAEYGLAQGIGAQKFNPMGLITREEAYQMLYNAAKRTGFPKSLAARDLSAEFSDLAAVGDWAKESVTWCLNQNLTVNLKGAVSPTEEITRGEMSALILKLLQRSELVDVRSKF
ncbi:MAG: S-layer homology domain-containing protein, partial [Oscillospiraceae bacterium]